MNCRERCLYREQCKKKYPRVQGEEGLSGDDCPCYWKIDDLMQDARIVSRELEDEDEVPFCEPYNGPEEEEEC